MLGAERASRRGRGDVSGGARREATSVPRDGGGRRLVPARRDPPLTLAHVSSQWVTPYSVQRVVGGGQGGSRGGVLARRVRRWRRRGRRRTKTLVHRPASARLGRGMWWQGASKQRVVLLLLLLLGLMGGRQGGKGGRYKKTTCFLEARAHRPRGRGRRGGTWGPCRPAQTPCGCPAAPAAAAAAPPRRAAPPLPVRKARASGAQAPRDVTRARGMDPTKDRGLGTQGRRTSGWEGA